MESMEFYGFYGMDSMDSMESMEYCTLLHNKITGKKKRFARARDARARETSLVFQKEKSLLWRPHNKIPGKKTKRLARARDARAREPSLVFFLRKKPLMATPQ